MFFLKQKDRDLARSAGISDTQIDLHQRCADELSTISMKWYGYDARKSEQRLNLILVLGLLAAIFGVSVWSSPSPWLFYYWGVASSVVMLVFSCLFILERSGQSISLKKLLKKSSPLSATEKMYFGTMILIMLLQGVLLAENFYTRFSVTMLTVLVILQILAQAGLMRLLTGATARLLQAHADLQRMNRELGYREDALSDVLNRFQQSIRLSAFEKAQGKQALKNQSRRLSLLWIPLAGLVALGIAYFGGVSLAQQTGAGFIYLGSLRVNLMFHGLFWALMIFTEYLMAQSLFCFWQVRNARRALRMGWSVNERISAQGLLVPGRQEMRAQRRLGSGLLLGALLALGVDMALNIHYFMSVQRVGLMGILVSLIPAMGVFVISLILAAHKHQLSRHEHFGYLPAQADQPEQTLTEPALDKSWAF